MEVLIIFLTVYLVSVILNLFIYYNCVLKIYLYALIHNYRSKKDYIIFFIENLIFITVSFVPIANTIFVISWIVFSYLFISKDKKEVLKDVCEL